jgi:hypothetical protein
MKILINEFIENIISESLKANPIAYKLAAVLFLISFAVKVATGVIDFHEAFSVQRYLKRLSSLADGIDKNSLIYQYVKKLRDDEVFRIASGIESYPEQASMLMQTYLLGVASKSELKRLSFYLLPKGEKVSFSINHRDKFLFVYSLFCFRLFLSLAIYVIVWNYVTGDCLKFFAAIIFAFILMAIGLFLGRDYKTWRILKRVKERLLELNMVANPDDSIEWNTFG